MYGASSSTGPRPVERGEEAREKSLHARMARCLGRIEAGDVTLVKKWCDKLGIPRQHVDRNGPGWLGQTSDYRWRLVIAEQDDEPVAGDATGEPARERCEIIAQAVEIVRGELAPVRLTPDLFHRRRGNAGKGAGVVPISEVGWHRSKRDMARNQHQLGEHRRCGTERRTYRCCAVESELIGNREPAE